MVETTALVTVIATATDKNAPTRLATADIATATFGLGAPVAIEVAMALPVSWTPFVKSKPRAVTTTNPKMNVSALMLASIGRTQRAARRRHERFTRCSRPGNVARASQRDAHVKPRAHLAHRAVFRRERRAVPPRSTPN